MEAHCGPRRDPEPCLSSKLVNPGWPHAPSCPASSQNRRGPATAGHASVPAPALGSQLAQLALPAQEGLQPGPPSCPAPRGGGRRRPGAVQSSAALWNSLCGLSLPDHRVSEVPVAWGAVSWNMGSPRSPGLC